MTTTSSAQSIGTATLQIVKRRAACEECRFKKLKCSGEQPSCLRCQKENIDCVYSVQKQMGRPKKRQRSEERIDGADQLVSFASTAAAPQGTTHANCTSTAYTAQPGLALGYGGSSLDSPNIAFCPGSLISREAVSYQSTANSDSTFGVPDLTADTSGSSPAAPEFPLELTQTRHNSLDDALGVNLQYGLPIHDYQATTTMASGVPTCACLSTMYLTLNSLNSMDTNAPFPYALHPLRTAMQSAAEILTCNECPKQFFSGMQNTSAMNSLLMGMTERFSKVLSGITDEAERAQAAGETKKFRLADLQSPTSHLHAGGLGCVGAFTVSLSPQEWRRMCKQVVRAEVFGPSDGNMCCPYLTGLMTQMETRQLQWHARCDSSSGCEASFHVGGRNLALGQDHGDKLCLRMLSFSRQLLDACDWS